MGRPGRSSLQGQPFPEPLAPRPHGGRSRLSPLSGQARPATCSVNVSRACWGTRMRSRRVERGAGWGAHGRPPLALLGWLPPPPLGAGHLARAVSVRLAAGAPRGPGHRRRQVGWDPARWSPGAVKAAGLLEAARPAAPLLVPPLLGRKCRKAPSPGGFWPCTCTAECGRGPVAGRSPPPAEVPAGRPVASAPAPGDWVPDAATEKQAEVRRGSGRSRSPGARGRRALGGPGLGVSRSHRGALRLSPRREQREGDPGGRGLDKGWGPGGWGDSDPVTA